MERGFLSGRTPRRVTNPIFGPTLDIKAAQYNNKPAILIQSLHALASAGQTPGRLFSTYDINDNVRFSVPIAGGPQSFGGAVRAQSANGQQMGFDGTVTPVAILGPEGNRFYISTKQPSTTTGLSGKQDDILLELHSTGTATFTLYQCTVTGSPGTWVTLTS